MSRFDPRPGQPNSPGPGKRPLHNMCPTVLCRDGKPFLGLGAVGGRRIPNTLFDVLAYLLGQGKSLEEAVKAPRMNTQGNLTVNLEAGWPEEDRKYLQQIGYEVRTGPGAALNAIGRDPATGAFRSAMR
jgi:gamma-glutamyltranspeptidase/glutathione hydrolase